MSGLDIKQWAIEYYQKKGMEVSTIITEEGEMVQKAAEAVQTSEYRLVLQGSKPKRCKVCGSRSLHSVVIRNGKGAVGLAKYCTYCGEINSSNGKITQEQLTNTVLGQTIENLVEGAMSHA